jgi:hypothetical protein
MATNEDLHNSLLPLEFYGGIYNVTNIINISFRNLPCYIICNLDVAAGDGSHWIAIALSKDVAFYFDSFGERCKNDNILCMLRKIGYNSYDYNKKPIQHPTSIHCGHFAIGFILALNSNYSIEKYLNLFKRRSSLNDKVVENFLSRFSIEIKLDI